MLAHVFTYRADDIQRATQINPGPSTHQNLAEHVPTRRFIPLTAWPLELVLEVAQYLDESSLLDVGATCKQLNALAASLYYNEQHTSSSSFHLQGNDSKGQLLYAARLFFQAPRITRISFVVKPGIQRFRADMEELVRLINCTNVLERVELNFGGIDAALSKTGLETWLQDEENKRAYPVDFGAASLVKLIADVVDAVESAGCHDLSLVGGDFLCQSIHSIQTSIGTRRRKQGTFHDFYSHQHFSHPHNSWERLETRWIPPCPFSRSLELIRCHEFDTPTCTGLFCAIQVFHRFALLLYLPLHEPQPFLQPLPFALEPTDTLPRFLDPHYPACWL